MGYGIHRAYEYRQINIYVRVKFDFQYGLETDPNPNQYRLILASFPLADSNLT